MSERIADTSSVDTFGRADGSGRERDDSGSEVSLDHANWSSAFTLGQTIADRYLIERQLGKGGMGMVYLAQHTHIRKHVALKVLHPWLTSVPDLVQRFRREALAAAHIDHPNVATATDSGTTDDGSFYLVLEYVDGISLRDVLSDGPLPLSRGLHIAIQIASALVHTHSLGIIHRDLKPDNILLVHKGDDPDFVKVLDFGIAKVPEERLGVGPTPRESQESVRTQTGVVFGTPAYMAPEQAIGQQAGTKADLYALGVILFEMLSGRTPFENESVTALLGAQLTEVAPSIASKAGAEIPERVEVLVQSLLAREASERPESAALVLAELRALAADSGAPKAQRARTPSKDRLRSRALGWSVGFASAIFLGYLAVRTLDSPSSGEGVQVASVVATAATQALGPVVESKGLTLEKIGRAEALGSQALEALAAEYPVDARVREAQLRAYQKEGKPALAVTTVSELLRLDPSMAERDDILQTLKRAAVVNAEARDRAVELMESKLGSKGIDMLYELASNGPPAMRQKFMSSLQKPEVLYLASKGARFVVELRAAASCEAKRNVLERGGEADPRAIPHLRPLGLTKGCGFMKLSDCFPCLRTPEAADNLKKALAASGASAQ